MKFGWNSADDKGSPPMLSIFKTATDLDRLEEVQHAAKGCLAKVVSLSGEYAVDLDASLVAKLRQHMQRLREQAQEAQSPEDFQAIQTVFQEQVRSFQRAAEAQIQKLREEIAGAEAAVQGLAESVSGNSADYEESLKTDLKGFEKLVDCEDLPKIRSGARNLSSKVLENCERMQRANQVVILQLRDEIRLLHRKVEEVRQSPAENSDHEEPAKPRREETAAPAKTEFEPSPRIAELLRTGNPFGVLVVAVRNLPRLAAQLSPAVFEKLLELVDERMRAFFGRTAVFEYLSEGVYAVMLDQQQEKALNLSSNTARHLSGEYTVNSDGRLIRLQLQATAGLVYQRSGADSRVFCQKLEQMMSALSSS